MTKRRNYTTSFKSKVALEALRGELTLPQIADKYGIAQSIVANGKRLPSMGFLKFSLERIPYQSIRKRSGHCMLKLEN